MALERISNQRNKFEDGLLKEKLNPTGAVLPSMVLQLKRNPKSGFYAHAYSTLFVLL